MPNPVLKSVDGRPRPQRADNNGVGRHNESQMVPKAHLDVVVCTYARVAALSGTQLHSLRDQTRGTLGNGSPFTAPGPIWYRRTGGSNTSVSSG